MCPDYLFTIKGLTTIILRNVYPMVKQVWDSKQALNFISSLVNAVPHMQRENVKNEVQLLLNLMNIMCLDTKETGNTLSPRFNVYADNSRMSFDKVWSCLSVACTWCRVRLGPSRGAPVGSDFDRMVRDDE